MPLESVLSQIDMFFESVSDKNLLLTGDIGSRSTACVNRLLAGFSLKAS